MSEITGSEDARAPLSHHDAAADEVATSPTSNALTVPAFRWLWLNNVFFFIVMNAQRFVFGWLVLERLDGDERSQGLVVFALGVPALFLVLHAGVWADRHDRKRLLVTSQIASLTVMGVTAALIAADQISFSIAIVLAVVAGGASAIGQPVRSALVPAIVQREQLFNAIAVTALAMTMSMILGPVMVEAVGDRYGFAAAYWFLAGLMVVGLLALGPLVVPPRPQEPKPAADGDSVWAQTIEALRHVLADNSLKKLFLLLTVAGLTVNPAVMVSLQAFVKEELGRDAGDAAPLLALMGLGLAIASVFVMRKGDMANKGAAFQRAMMVGSTMTVLMGRTTEYRQLLPLVFTMGLAGGFYINMNQGLIQANTPPELMGRVMGLYALVSAGLLPLGALAIGIVSSSIGIGNTISIAAAISLVTVVTVYFSDAELRHLD